MNEAENLLKAGVKELLVVSQDTSAYGVDVRYRTGFWRGKPLKTCMTDSCARWAIWRQSMDLGPLHYVYPYPHVDEVIPLMAEGRVLYLACRSSMRARASSGS
jgi:ribosomal protein S12 methylthiotransferase